MPLKTILLNGVYKEVELPAFFSFKSNVNSVTSEKYVVVFPSLFVNMIAFYNSSPYNQHVELSLTKQSLWEFFREDSAYKASDDIEFFKAGMRASDLMNEAIMRHAPKLKANP